MIESPPQGEVSQTECPFQSVICSQPRPGGAELPPGPEPPGAVAETEGSNGVEAMEQQPPENSPE